MGDSKWSGQFQVGHKPNPDQPVDNSDYHHQSTMRKWVTFVASDNLPINSVMNMYDK